MQGNGETEKPKHHTDEEAVGSRWSKPEQQLGTGMSLRKTRLASAKFCQALTIPLVGWCVIMTQKIGHHLKSGRGVVRRVQG